MYIREISRRNKDGSKVTYVQLAHNYRDPETGTTKAKVLHSLGRKEHLDVDALRRLVRSIGRFLPPGEAAQLPMVLDPGKELTFVESRPMGDVWLLWGLWNAMGIPGALARAFAERKHRHDPAEDLFTMVANRATEPASKLALVEWAQQDVALPFDVEALDEDRLYRSMDLMLAAEAEVQKEVFFAAADLLQLEVDLLLYDTTSSYFEMEGDDRDILDRQRAWDAFDKGERTEPPPFPRPQVVNDPPFRRPGHSKDHRPDRAQIVIGMAVTRQGIPVRCWVLPGNTNDATTIARVKSDLAGWRLNRVVWAVDRGMVSEANLKTLRAGGAHYIAGQKLRAGSKDNVEALARAGRFKKVADNLEVKEVVVGEGEARTRYVLVRNPAQRERDRYKREQLLARLEEDLAELPDGGEEHTQAVCRLLTHHTKKRYLRQDKKGRLHINRAAVRAEERLDGKYLLSTSDDSLSTEDVALGYKQLLEVERAWRSMKSELDLRPMHHRLEHRIRAHVLLCWLALLLVRVAEVRSEQPWSRIRAELHRIHRGVFRGKGGELVRRTELTDGQRSLFKRIGVDPPPLVSAIRS
jgi:hypothetical protein